MNFISKIEQKLVHNFWFLPPDLHERQRFMSSKIPAGKTVLDVGGEQPILEQVTQMAEYYTLNVDRDINQTSKHIKKLKKSMLYDGKNLPFDDNTFDIVVCIDVLEHVSQKERTPLIKEMLRVSKEVLICSAPLGTAEHIQAEKDLLRSLTDKKEASFLEDHIQKGLPTPESLQKWTQEIGGTLSYSGDFRWSNILYKFQRSEITLPVFNHLYFFFKLSIYFICNVVLYPFLIDQKNHSSSTNRFYFEVKKAHSLSD